MVESVTRIKKFILLSVFLIWGVAHPCFAACSSFHHARLPTSQSTSTKMHKTASKNKQEVHQKKKLPGSRQNKKQTKKPLSRKPTAPKKYKKKMKKRHIHSDFHSLKPPLKIDTENITKSSLPGYLLSSIEKRLVDFVRNTVTSIRYSAYKLGGSRIDTPHGVYVVDCSTYVDHVLKSVYPGAFTSLTSWSGTAKPTTNDFYHYFTNLADDHYWHTVEDVEQLRPGDVLVFRYKNKFSNVAGGHVMIVMDKPVQEEINTFMLRIADSAPSRHSTDTRLPHESGIGIGTMLLKVDPRTYQPSAYAWRIGSHWETNANFAMARPGLA